MIALEPIYIRKRFKQENEKKEISLQAECDIPVLRIPGTTIGICLVVSEKIGTLKKSQKLVSGKFGARKSMETGIGKNLIPRLTFVMEKF